MKEKKEEPIYDKHQDKTRIITARNKAFGTKFRIHHPTPGATERCATCRNLRKIRNGKMVLKPLREAFCAITTIPPNKQRICEQCMKRIGGCVRMVNSGEMIDFNFAIHCGNIITYKFLCEVAHNRTYTSVQNLFYGEEEFVADKESDQDTVQSVEQYNYEEVYQVIDKLQKKEIVIISDYEKDDINFKYFDD